MFELIFPENLFLDVNKEIKRFIPNEAYYYLPYLKKIEDDTLEIIRLSLPQNKIEFEAKLGDEGEIEYIGRLNRIDVNLDRGVIVAYLQNGKNILFYPKRLGKKLSDVIHELRNAELVYLVLRLRRGRKFKKTNIVVADYEVLAKEKASLSDIMAYKESIKLKNWEMLLASVGIVPTIDSRELLKLYLPRLISLFRVNTPAQNSYNHVLQFTLPGTGKTMFYSKLALVWNMEVLTRLPSRARLVADARSNKLGLVFLRRIIVIDAFDKELPNHQNVEEFFTSVETGMANAIWSLEKSSNLDMSQSFKETGFVFLGNLEGTLDLADIMAKKQKTMRDYLRERMEKEGISGSLTSAFLSRLAIVDINDTSININDYVQDKVMRASYLRTLLEYIEEQANMMQVDTTKLSELKGRYYTYGLRIAKILRALEIEPAEELALKLVRGDWDWDVLLASESKKDGLERIDQSQIQWQ